MQPIHGPEAMRRAQAWLYVGGGLILLAILATPDRDYPAAAPVTLEVPSLDLGAPDSVAAPSFDLDIGQAPSAPAGNAAQTSGMMDFNLGDLNLDLGPLGPLLPPR